jgi:DNA-directed RNA polymerase subunit RPC12/RpoP
LNKPKALAKTKCACGFDLEADVGKPKRFSPYLTKIQCENCDSKYLLKSEIALSDKTGRRILKTTFKVLEISKKLESLIQAELDSRITTGPRTHD